MVEPISNNDEQAYLEEVENPTQWCQLNKLFLNVGKTKELVFGKKHKGSYSTLNQQTPVARLPLFKYLGVQITEDLPWSGHTERVVMNAQYTFTISSN